MSTFSIVGLVIIMDVVGVEGVSLNSSGSSFGRVIKRKLTNFSILGYSASFLFAAVITLGLIGFCCWLIYLDFVHGAQFTISGWAQSVITFLLGAWITDRPRFFKSKKSEKS